jgi:hypothetical protein
MLQLDVMLIAFRRKAQSAIKKSVEQAQSFHLAVNFNGAPLEALSLQEFPERCALVTAIAQQNSESATPGEARGSPISR